MDKPKRSSKKVNYASLDAGNSEDDDFVDANANPKKKSDGGKSKRNKGNKENIDNDSASDRHSVAKSPRRRSPCKRVPLEERKFQKELQMALMLSEKNGSTSELPEEALPIEISTSTSDDSNFAGFSNQEPISRKTDLNPSVPMQKLEDKSVKGQDAVSLAKRDEAQCKRKKEEEEEEEPVPSTSTGFTAKRQRKKVNFKEEDSDDYSAEEESAEPSSESEWSDFSESPKKKKKKSNSTKVPPTKKNPRSSTKEKTDPKKHPAIPKLVIKTKAITKNDSSASKSSAKSNSSPGVATSLITATPKLAVSNSTVSTPGTCRIGLGHVKTGFRSPLTNDDCSSKSKGSPTSVRSSPGIGIRLGLSRRGNFKPLHPNASVK